MNPGELLRASRLGVSDVKSCEQWLARAALGDTRLACLSFVELLDELEDSPPPDPDYLQILRRLRRPMRAALEEQARRFSARPLPLAPAEEAAFVQVCDLWLALLRAWQRLQRIAESGSSELAPSRALLALRATESAAGLIAVHFAARRAVEANMWRWLHQSYAHAERHHLSESPVAEHGADSRTSTAAYAELLLLDLARPYGLAQRELIWTQRWARRWASKVRLWRSTESGGGLAVDLESITGAVWTPAGVPGAGIRFVDCSEALRSVRKRLHKLEHDADPAEIGLGKDCTRPAVDELLARLARCWSDTQKLNQFPRRSVASSAELVQGLPEIFHAIAGTPFEGEQDPWAYSRRSADQIHIFQRAIEAETIREKVRKRGVGLESWHVVDESAHGFQLRRAGPGSPLALRQLLALQPAGASRFLLCEVRWLRQDPGGALAAGIRAMPGLPKPCAVRTAACADGTENRWLPAFLMPVAEGGSATLLAPAGLYQGRRELELRDDGKLRPIVLMSLVERGHDFDLLAFSCRS